MLVLVKAMKNPRSALCKTSIMASSDIFNAFGDKLLLESTTSEAFNHLVWILPFFLLCFLMITNLRMMGV